MAADARGTSINTRCSFVGLQQTYSPVLFLRHEVVAELEGVDAALNEAEALAGKRPDRREVVHVVAAVPGNYPPINLFICKYFAALCFFRLVHLHFNMLLLISARATDRVRGQDRGQLSGQPDAEGDLGHTGKRNIHSLQIQCADGLTEWLYNEVIQTASPTDKLKQGR